MANIDLSKLVNEQILAAAKNRDLMEEGATGNYDDDIANALNEADGRAGVPQPGVHPSTVGGYNPGTMAAAEKARVGRMFDRAVGGQDGRGAASSQVAAIKGSGAGRGTGSDMHAKFSGSGSGPEPKGMLAGGADWVKEHPKAAAGVGLAAGALGAGLAARKYLKARRK